MHYSIFYHCGSIDSLSVETQVGTFYRAKGLLDAFYSIVLSVSNIFSQTPLTRLHLGLEAAPMLDRPCGFQLSRAVILG